MKAIIVGMGVQGNKRKKFLGKDFIYSVDKFKSLSFFSEVLKYFFLILDETKIKLSLSLNLFINKTLLNTNLIFFIDIKKDNKSFDAA